MRDVEGGKRFVSAAFLKPDSKNARKRSPSMEKSTGFELIQ